MRILAGQKLVYAWLTLISIGVGFLLVGKAISDPAITTFDHLQVHRIDIVEPNGNPRVVIYNRVEFPGLYWGGKEYGHWSRDAGGFLFFNDDGDEVGGMTFQNRKVNDKFVASSGIMFDQYKQDQTVGITYDDENGQRRAGLRVWDRPDEPLLPVIELSDKIAKAKTDAEREEYHKEMNDIAAKWPKKGERLFAGKSHDDSIVRLADGQGRPRLVLKVDAAGNASVQFLDENGKVVKEISPTADAAPAPSK